VKLDQLREVVAIAEFGALRAAARHLKIAQPLLTRNLGNLERELGSKIFERHTQGMLPTLFGGVVIDGARRILGEVDQLSEAIFEYRGDAQSKRARTKAKRGSVVPLQRDEDRADHVFIDVMFEIFRLYGRIMRAGDRMGKPVGITGSRWQILGPLQHRKATVSDIARHMGLQRQSVQRTIDVLRREGLVEMVDNPNHRRAKHAVLTAKGWGAIREANKVRDEWIRRTALGIADSEFEAAYVFLRRLRKRLGDRLLP
jgi:DNA-binding MarR family transcriptional regulator